MTLKICSAPTWLLCIWLCFTAWVLFFSSSAPISAAAGFEDWIDEQNDPDESLEMQKTSQPWRPRRMYAGRNETITEEVVRRRRLALEAYTCHPEDNKFDCAALKTFWSRTTGLRWTVAHLTTETVRAHDSIFGLEWMTPQSSVCEWLGIKCFKDAYGINRVYHLELPRSAPRWHLAGILCQYLGLQFLER